MVSGVGAPSLGFWKFEIWVGVLPVIFADESSWTLRFRFRKPVAY